MSEQNERISITHKLYGQFRWAFSSRKKPSFNKLQIGHYCIFTGSQTGNIYLAQVTNKSILSAEIYSSWAFKPSKTGAVWKFGFTIGTPMKLNVTVENVYEMIKNYRKTIGCLKHFQAQSMVEIPEDVFLTFVNSNA